MAQQQQTKNQDPIPAPDTQLAPRADRANAPSVGRIVHYYTPAKPAPGWVHPSNRMIHQRNTNTVEPEPRGQGPYAATIAAVNEDGTVNLCVIDSKGNTFGVEGAREGSGWGTWGWPPRV